MTAATVVVGDVEALLLWLAWTFAQAKAELVGAAQVSPNRCPSDVLAAVKALPHVVRARRLAF